MVTPSELRVGERVAVRLGDQAFEATVLEVYGTPDRARVVVSFPIEGPNGEIEGETTVSLPSSVVEGVYA